MSSSSSPAPLDVLTDADFQQIVRDTIAHGRTSNPGAAAASLLPVASSTVHKLRINIESCSSPGGFMGDYYRIAIAVLDDHHNGSGADDGNAVAEWRYFVKAPPTHDKTLLEVMRVTGMAARESHMYATLLPQLDRRPFPGNWSPTCYYNRNDLLIFADLGAQHYAHLPERQFFDETHITLALRSLARMHASSIRFEHTSGMTVARAFGAAYLGEPSFRSSNQWYVVGMQAAVALAAEACATRPDRSWARRFDGPQLLERLFAVQQLLDVDSPVPEGGRRYRNVFCHRDLWGNNIMFRYEEATQLPTHAVFIDYQTCRYIPAALDLLQLLYLNTRRAQRTATGERRYLRCYHEALSNELAGDGIRVADELPWSELLESYEHYRMFGLACALQYQPLIRMPDDRFNVMRLKDPEMYARLSNVKRDDFVLELMRSDAFYGEVLGECVEELLEVVFGEGEEGML